MMVWPRVRLDEVAGIVMGQSPPGDTYNIEGNGLPFFQGKADFGDRYPTTRKWCSAPTRTAEPHDILLSVRAPVGPTNLAHEDCCIGRGLAAIRANPVRADQDYLRFFFKYQEPFLSKQGQGSTFAAIGGKEVARLEVPLPPLSEQRRIVEILDQADRLRGLSAEVDDKADRIIQAIFLKMFGDPARNPMGWRTAPIGDAIAETQYGTSKRPSAEGKGVLVLRMNNISSSGDIDLSEVKFVDLDTTEREHHLLQPGDILFNRTNSIELVGKTGLWMESDRPAVAASYLIRVRVNRDKTLPSYLWALMNTPYMKIVLATRARRAVGMANINATELRRLPGMFPLLQCQRDFDALLGSTHLANKHRHGSRIILERLFAHLLNRAFSGALTRSMREAHLRVSSQEMEHQAKALKEVSP